MRKETDTIIIGAGLAGLVAAYELLLKGRQVLIIDAQPRNKIGGLARTAFGGMALIGTPQQKFKGVKDSPEQAYKDWCSFAEFNQNDIWPKAWAKYYVENSISHIYEPIKKLGVKFLPAVNWVERGLYVPGNSLPRYHILWGASLRLIHQLVKALKSYEGNKLNYRFESKVEQLITANKRIVGCSTKSENGSITEYYAEKTVIACGGFTGNLNKVRKVWPVDWKRPPETLLNGAHPDNDGKLHDMVAQLGGQVTHLDKMWHYAAGIPNPEPEFENQGLSLIPCKSALWLDHLGHRIGPEPLVTGYDTFHMCRQISRLQLPHSWQILNRRIALKELAISGCEHNPAIRDRMPIKMLKEVLLGNHRLVSQMVNQSDNFLLADNLEMLVNKMNQLTPLHPVKLNALSATLGNYDEMIKRGESFWNDDQIRRILQIRNWFSDRLRTCYPKPIQDGSELIAIKLNLITRKSLGGIKTDLNCRVLTEHDKPLEGLYAIGEAAGFGGGGANGKRSLEGTFLSGCILTARKLAQEI